MLASPIVSRVAVLSTSGELSATTLCSSFSETPSKASNLQQSAEAAQFHVCLYRSQQRAAPRCSAAPLPARVRAQRLLEYTCAKDSGEKVRIVSLGANDPESAWLYLRRRLSPCPLDATVPHASMLASTASRAAGLQFCAVTGYLRHRLFA
eukprot:scaffold72323_cov102-Phaeocystis_antarctica.AAC.1